MAEVVVKMDDKVLKMICQDVEAKAGVMATNLLVSGFMATNLLVSGFTNHQCTNFYKWQAWR